MQIIFFFDIQQSRDSRKKDYTEINQWKKIPQKSSTTIKTTLKEG
jgi:hypothetical protein